MPPVLILDQDKLACLHKIFRGIQTMDLNKVQAHKNLTFFIGPKNHVALNLVRQLKEYNSSDYKNWEGAEDVDALDFLGVMWLQRELLKPQTYVPETKAERAYTRTLDDAMDSYFPVGGLMGVTEDKRWGVKREALLAMRKLMPKFMFNNLTKEATDSINRGGKV